VTVVVDDGLNVLTVPAFAKISYTIKIKLEVCYCCPQNKLHALH